MNIKDFLNRGDRFAANAGAQLTEVREGYARAEMTVTQDHLNAGGVCQGGAIFTLADFALAVACNVGENPTVSVSSTIEYFSMAKGERLIATASANKSGRSMGFYTIDIADDLGTSIARMTSTCFRRS